MENFKLIFKNQLNKIGTVQVPHHGDIKSYNSLNFLNSNLICPISVGSKNIYAHPSNYVFTDLINNCNYTIIITDNLKDLYFEIIK